MPDSQSPLQERLSSWREIVKEAKEKNQTRHREAPEDEEFLLNTLKTLLWLGGLVACFLLAFQVSGGSILITVLILAIPLTTWFLCGLSRWGVILPISLIAALALQAALLWW